METIDMNKKEIRINIPEGYEIDKENSTFDCIKFKPKKLTYEDVEKELFKHKRIYYIDGFGNINMSNFEFRKNSNNITSEEQGRKLIAINKLLNVAKYLNGDWQPNWNTAFEECKYYISIIRGSTRIDRLCISGQNSVCNVAIVYFKSAELAQQAVDILGEYTIRLALSTDW